MINTCKLTAGDVEYDWPGPINWWLYMLKLTWRYNLATKIKQQDRRHHQVTDDIMKMILRSLKAADDD